MLDVAKMTQKHIFGWILLVFTIYIQLPLVSMARSYDYSDARAFAIMAFGAVVLFWFAFSRDKLSKAQLVPICAVGVLFVHSLFFCWVPGYTIYALSLWLSVMLLAVFVAKCDPEYVSWAFLLIVVVQFFSNYWKLVPWAHDYGDNYQYGTVRHTIRYTTLLYVGVIGCLELVVKKDRFKIAMGSIMGAVSLYTIFTIRPTSHTIVAITCLTFVVLAIRYSKMIVVPYMVICAVVVVYVYFKGDMILDHARNGWWSGTLSECFATIKSMVVGRGFYSFPLTHGESSFCTPWHPHNELINVLYDVGITGTIAILGFVGWITYRLRNSFVRMVGFLGVSGSMLTNSVRYPDMAFIWAFFIGSALYEQD